MENSFDLELSGDDPAEISKLLDRSLETLRRILERIEQDEEIIERNNAETWATLAHLRDLMRKVA